MTLDTGGVDVIVTAPSSSQYHQVIDHINAGPFNGIHDVAISLDGRFTYVTVGMTGANQLYMVDSEPFSATFNTLIKNITVGDNPVGVAVRPMMIDCAPENICKGDFDGDGDVDSSDLAVFAAEFGRTDCP